MDIPWSLELNDKFDWHNDGSTCIDIKMRGFLSLISAIAFIRPPQLAVA